MKLKGCRKISKDVEYSQEKKYTWLLNLWKDAEPHNQINVHVNNKEMSFYTDQIRGDWKVGAVLSEGQRSQLSSTVVS